MPFEADAPADPPAALAAFIARALADGLEFLILVPDDATLARLSSALPFDIRPLCLLLPEADFAIATALRATLTLLMSRLGRDGDDSRTSPWLALRDRLDRSDELWRQARNWITEAPAAGALPLQLAALFPAFVLPAARLDTHMPAQAGITLLYRCEMPPTLSGNVTRLLRVGRPATRIPGHADAPDETARLLIERARLSQDLTDLEIELTSVQAELGAFRQEYYRRVGALIAALDALRAADLRVRAAQAPQDSELRDAVERSEKEAAESAAEAQQVETRTMEPTIPSSNTDVRQAYRRLAQQIHPDRARDETDRTWRTHLMSEANLAYRHGDLVALQEIATLWAEQTSMQRHPGRPSSELLAEQITRLRVKLDGVEAELHRLFGSALYELFIAARQASRQGRDLLQEMATRLSTEIAAAGGAPPEPA